MPEPMEVDLRLPNVDALVEGLNAVADSYEKVEKAQGSGGKSPAYLQGPNQRLQKIAEQLQRAEAEGNDAALADLKILEFRAKRNKSQAAKAMARGEDADGLLEVLDALSGTIGKLTHGNILGAVRNLSHGIDLIGTGGLNIDQKVQGAAVGGNGNGTGGGSGQADGSASAAAGAAQALAAGGGEAGGLDLAGAAAGAGLDLVAAAAALLAPELLVAAAVVVLIIAGFKLAVDAAKQFAAEVIAASERLHQVAAAEASSGGSSSDVFRLRGLGVDPGQAAGAAGGLRERLSSDPFARMAAHDLGVDPQLPAILGGPQNNARILREVLTALRGVTDTEEQLMLARRLGVESMVDELRVSERVFRQRMRQAEVEEQLFGDKTGALQASRDLQGEQKTLTQGMEDLKNSMAEPFIPDFSEAVHALNIVVTESAPALHGIAQGIEFLTVKLSPLYWTLHAISTLDDLAHPKNRAEDEHTKAMREHSDALAKASGNVGPRGQNAFPVNLRGEMQRQAMAGNNMRFGAFVP